MFIKRLALAAVLALSAQAAIAATILDTLSPNTAPFDFATNQGGIRFFNIGFFGPLGQSFTLDGDTENLAVSAFFSSFGTSADVTARLVSGAGVGGTVLGTQGFESDSITRFDAVLADFDFSAVGTLLAGIYTIVFSGSGALGGGEVIVNAPNDYTGINTAGTEAYGPNGLFAFGGNPARDFGILVAGDTVAPIPLPAGGLLLMGSLVGLGLIRRRA